VTPGGARLAAVVCFEREVDGVPMPDLQVAKTSGDGWYIAREVPPLVVDGGYGWVGRG
jgi:hypothetical protein